MKTPYPSIHQNHARGGWRGIVDGYDPNVFSFAMLTIAGNGHERDGRGDDDDLR